MKLHRNLGLLVPLLILILSAASLAMQAREKIPDHVFVRETVIDEEGLQQWAPWEVKCPQCRGVKEIDCPLCVDRDSPNCIECGGDKKAVCRVCVGKGELPDPVIHIACAYCRGAGVYPCAHCLGAGTFSVREQDDSVRIEKCRGCKEHGGFECTPCGGTRLLPAISIKKNPLAEAEIEDMQDTREVLVETLAVLEKFKHDSSHRKTEKALQKLLKDPSKTYPVLKDMLALLEEVHKAFSKSGSGYENYDGKLTHQFYIFQDRTVWLLRHQILLLDKEIARAEFNAAVLEAK